jgi:hypothetical protein
MRLWHLVLVILFLAILLTVAREEAGRVAIVVFATGLVELVLALAAIMSLFRTMGAIGEARTLFGYCEAVLATLLVLVVASALMNGILWIGYWLVEAAVA